MNFHQGDKSKAKPNPITGKESKDAFPKKPFSTQHVIQLQRTIGNRAVGQLLRANAERPSSPTATIQRAAITPATFFGASQPDNNIDAAIAGNDSLGFGVPVNGVTWHTKLTFDPLVTPGTENGVAMNPEGSGVRGVIGPDHPFGSQPSSASATENNHRAATLRHSEPHVAAHIVNDQLGGPGEDQNLFAFPGTANTQMEQKVEKNMKAAVEAGNFIYYEASVQHPAQGPANSITMSWNKLDNTGADMGGGQTNAVINADRSNPPNGNTVHLGGGTAARSTLIHPKNVSAITSDPWGPFQMPDPKISRQLTQYLNVDSFPAVGNDKAFEAFLNSYKDSAINIDRLFMAIPIHAFTNNLKRWIVSKSNITIKRSRGVTNDLLTKLQGTAQERRDAFMAILATTDANKVIAHSSKELAKSARANARTRI
ncbi:hypothetical protein [Paenibacillus sp. V4I5]|uniref:hypothetical protein n=1 Tax=Paenibacillus sp. V4I5 TaxID=3042306 RepID=UPI002794284E|nr:hypothetical protein [Paenibacillus sp. V4I5]MDQ0917055.1 hypothetical protein [Paenibacillus sp. V4I5]